VRAGRAGAEAGQQGLYKIDSRFHGHHLPRLQAPEESQLREVFRRCQCRPGLIAHVAPDVVDLDSEQVTKAVRKKAESDACFHQVFRLHPCDTPPVQKSRYCMVRAPVQVRVGDAGPDRLAELALQHTHVVDHRGELVIPISVRPGDIAGVPVEGAAGIDQQAVARSRRRCLTVAVLVVQRGGMVVQCDDRAIGQVLFSLGGSAKERIKDSVFALSISKCLSRRAVSRRCNTRRLAHAVDLPICFRGPVEVQKVHQRFRVALRAGQYSNPLLGHTKQGDTLVSGRQVAADVGGIPKDAHIEQLADQRIGRRRRQVPVILWLADEQERRTARFQHYRRPRMFEQRHPLQEMRVRHVAVGLIVLKPVLANSAASHDGIQAAAVHRGLIAPPDLSEVLLIQGTGVFAGRRPATVPREARHAGA